ncbi:MAG TPA: response regulator [Nitrospirota bacterium]|nr:response regulator [Nitrospirota bacterium]
MYDITKMDPCSHSYGREKRDIVVVDSDESHLYYMSILLERLEYCIYAAKNAEDALDRIAVMHPALVLTEISLPGMNGIELLKKIKRNPLTHSVPMIVLTTATDPALKSESIKEGCEVFLQKPVDPDVLYYELQKAMGIRARQFIRLQTRLNVIVGNETAVSSSVISDYVTALSEQGMFISTSIPKPVGLHIPITIFLGAERLKVEGLVLYSFARAKGPLKTPGMGIKFVSIEPEDKRLIRGFIRREIAKKLTPTQKADHII